jgi:hypothetical protein
MNKAFLYGVMVVVNVGLTQLGVELARGSVPVPEAAMWAVPICVAMITAATALLPRLGSEPVKEVKGRK